MAQAKAQKSNHCSISQWRMVVAGIVAFGVILFACSVIQGQKPTNTQWVRKERTGVRKAAHRGPLKRMSVTDCPPVKAGQIYRFIAGMDSCMTPMSTSDIAAQLNDPYFTTVLRPNAGGPPANWPASVPAIVAAVAKANPGLQQFSYMLGEGSQIPTSLTPVDSNRDLRYVVAWGPSGQSPVIFLSARPAGLSATQGGTPPAFLQVISYDPKKNKYNYYQYVSNADVSSALPDKTQTWSWAGDSGYARKAQTVGQGCFSCHLNGALNMKELTVPWNNWNSPAATISASVVPPAVVKDSLFQQLSGADKFQSMFQGVQQAYTARWVSSAINNQNKTVSNVPELLRRLIVTTTVNFASTQTRSASPNDITGLPVNFFLYDDALRNIPQLGLQYSVPTLTLKRADYNAFVQNNNFALVNTANNRPPVYSQKGDTYFAFFVPVPAFEDTKAIQQLIIQKVISAKFAACVLMVDFQNPVFSPARSSLMKYAQQVSTGTADGNDIPNRFVALVTQAAQGQPACDPSKISQCSAERQFLYYWNQNDWKTACQTQIQNYLNSVGNRITTTAGVNDYMTLSISRGIQFSKYPLVSNLHEFDLLLPTTKLGNIFVQMDTDGTISPQASY